MLAASAKKQKESTNAAKPDDKAVSIDYFFMLCYNFIFL